MRAYVVGAGAVGNYFADLLRGIGATVTFAPRELAEVTPVETDLAIVAVKAYDTGSAIETLRRALAADAPVAILCPQNGVGNEERLAEAFGADRIVACALTVPVDRTRDGRSVAAGNGGIALAPVGHEAHNWLIAAFERTGSVIQVTADYRALKWSKLALNVVANASCAILNVLPERLVQMDAVFALEIRAIRETAAVMRAIHVEAIDLPRYPVRALQAIVRAPSPLAKLILSRRIAAGRGRKPPSLLLDLRAAKGRTEVDVLCGAVAAAAASAGVRAPVNSVYARIVNDISHMPQLWAKYRERPEALASEAAAEIRRQSVLRTPA